MLIATDLGGWYLFVPVLFLVLVAGWEYANIMRVLDHKLPLWLLLPAITLLLVGAWRSELNLMNVTLFLGVFAGLPGHVLSAPYARFVPWTAMILPFWLVRAQVPTREMFAVWPGLLACGVGFGLGCTERGTERRRERGAQSESVEAPVPVRRGVSGPVETAPPVARSCGDPPCGSTCSRGRKWPGAVVPLLRWSWFCSWSLCTVSGSGVSLGLGSR